MLRNIHCVSEGSITRRDDRADDDGPGQHQHRDGTDQDEQHAAQQAEQVRPLLAHAVGAVERGAQCLYRVRGEEQRQPGAHGQEIDAGRAHDGLDLRRDPRRDPLRQDLKQLIDGLVGELASAEEDAGKRAEKDAERE